MHEIGFGKTIFLAAALLAAASAPTAAMTVEVAMAIDRGAAAATTATRTAFMSGCMGAFFDAGLVAADAPTAEIGREGWADPLFALPDAREGRADCVVAVYLTWARSAFAPAPFLPRLAEYRIVRVSDGAALAQGSSAAPPDSLESAKKAAKTAAAFGAELGKACAQKLATISIGGK